MDTPSWMQQGDLTRTEGDRLFSSGGGGQTLRFWLKPGTSRQVVFIDGADDGARLKEHNLTINGTFGNAFTCLMGIDPRGCPLCAMALRRKGHRDAGNVYGVAYYTVADLTPYTNKEGKVFPLTLMLLACKKEMLSKFSTMRKEMFGGSLLGRRFLAMRSAPIPGQPENETKTPRIGDNWQHMDQVPLVQFAAEAGKPPLVVPNITDPRTGQIVRPFDYGILLAPKTYEELAQVAESIERGGGGMPQAEQPVPYGAPVAAPVSAGQPVPYGAPAAAPAPFAAYPAAAPTPVAVPAAQPMPYVGAAPVAQAPFTAMPVQAGQPMPVLTRPVQPGDPGV
jgi:hypothetical protein